MTPIEYQQKFLEIQVPTVKDDKVVSWQSVKLEKYRLGLGSQAAFDGMLGKLWDHFGRGNEKRKTLTTHVQSIDGSRHHDEFTTWNDLWSYARKSLSGKGSPEEAAICLQLAARFNLLGGGDLQAYCDNNLGLDCNGFVGNYLVHGKAGAEWDGEGTSQNYLANTTIDIIARKGMQVTTIDQLVPTSSYIMAMVNGAGQIIKGGPGGGVGHIMITQPGVGFNAPYVNNGTLTSAWCMVAVESTGGVGLISKPCFIEKVDKSGNFTIKRMSHPLMDPLQFQAFRVP